MRKHSLKDLPARSPNQALMKYTTPNISQIPQHHPEDQLGVPSPIQSQPTASQESNQQNPMSAIKMDVNIKSHVEWLGPSRSGRYPATVMPTM
mmetsp:Transcript_105945/g.194302  ORF Transcript_105945/g.194302 Transcript_105945/m.194302 type:complete len:93 (-) Transcript_105945:93-371(-)